MAGEAETRSRPLHHRVRGDTNRDSFRAVNQTPRDDTPGWSDAVSLLHGGLSAIDGCPETVASYPLR